MADNIRIEIPGISPSSLPQWATEETLREVAKQLGAKRSGINSLDVSAKEAAKSTAQLTKAQKTARATLNEVANVAGSVAQTLFNTDGSLNSLLPVVETLTNAATKATKGLLSLGSGIPVIKGFVEGLGVATEVVGDTTIALFDLVSSVADSIADGFRGAATVGATLEGNFRQLATLSFNANISLEDLGETLNQATPALSAFTTSSEGARKVLGVLGNLQQDGTLEGFTRLGFTISELNEVGTDFLNILAQTGQTTMLNNMTETQLAKTAGQYALNLAALSRLTGQNRKELQQQMREESMRSNVQALLALKENELTGDQLESFRNLQVGLRQFSPQLADAFASISTLGVASAEQEAILAQLGPTGDLIRQFATAFKDGTGDVGDADVTGILQSVAEGITNDTTLRTALLAPAGGFPAALADVVGEGLAFAQKFIAGDVDLVAIREQVDKEREGRITAIEGNSRLVESIIDAQTNVATLSKDLQQLTITSGKTEKIITLTADTITSVTDLLKGFLDTDLKQDLTQGFESATQYIENANLNFAGNVDKEAIASGTATATDMSRVALDMVGDYQDSKMKLGMTMDYQNMLANLMGEKGSDYVPTKQDFNKIFADLNKKHNASLPMFQAGTPGVMDFGQSTLAFLHGKEAVIPAPRGNIPVDLGNTLEPVREMMTDLVNTLNNNPVATETVNSVQSNNDVVQRLETMIGVLKTIADGQYSGNSMFGKEIRRLGSKMSTDLYN